jgi:hypothetical protein
MTTKPQYCEILELALLDFKHRDGARMGHTVIVRTPAPLTADPLDLLTYVTFAPSGAFISQS